MKTTLSNNGGGHRDRRHGTWNGRSCRRGITLIEAIISLTISSSLLVAVGMAFNSSSKVIANNDQFYRAAQAARITVNQIMTEVRRCTSLSVYSDHIDMMTYASENRTYAFDPATGNVTIQRENLNPWVTNTMASNIAACSFASDGQTVSMNITVQVGSTTVQVSGSATPRRQVTYQ
jgi:type II secretory pathway pseudopilin PulG